MPSPLRPPTLLGLLLALCLCCGNAAAEAPAASKPRQFVYLLKLVPRLHEDKAWTAQDEVAVQAHFLRLKQATAEGRVIFAGRSDEPGDRTFGLVVFEAADETEALAFMNGDDAVRAGVMTAELHPFVLALQRR